MRGNCEKTLFECFPINVCPEPVLVKLISFSTKSVGARLLSLHTSAKRYSLLAQRGARSGAAQSESGTVLQETFNAFPFNVGHICPEPVLVKRSFLNRSKRAQKLRIKTHHHKGHRHHLTPPSHCPQLQMQGQQGTTAASCPLWCSAPSGSAVS